MTELVADRGAEWDESAAAELTRQRAITERLLTRRIAGARCVERSGHRRPSRNLSGVGEP